MIRERRTRFFESLEQDIRENPKRFWSMFKLRDKVKSLPEQISIPTIENYRSISLLNFISKVLERCVLVRLRYHLLAILDRAQHGFILGKSFVTQLVEVIDYIGSLLDSVKQSDVIYLDKSKAFDKVQHSLIFGKLRQYNICGNLLSWFTSYLRGRRQRVTCGNINGT